MLTTEVPTTEVPTTAVRSVRRAAAAVLLVVALAVALASCGSSPGDRADGVASLDGNKASSSGDSKDPKKKDVTEAERQDAMVEFATCMRKHGVDVPDPKTSGGSGSDKGGFKIAVRDGDAPGPQGGPVGPGGSPREAKAFEKANKVCEPILKDVIGDAPDISPEEEAKMRDEALKFARCMRKNGVDMPDPTFVAGSGGVTINADAKGKGEGPRPSTKTFDKANKACGKLLGGGDTMISGSGSSKAHS